MKKAVASCTAYTMPARLPLPGNGGAEPVASTLRLASARLCSADIRPADTPLAPPQMPLRRLSFTAPLEICLDLGLECGIHMTNSNKVSTRELLLRGSKEFKAGI